MLVRGLGLVLLTLGLPCSSSGDDSSVPSQKDPKNKVVIRQAGKEKVEIMLTSPKRFPVVNAIAVLWIGEQRSKISRYADDGSTNTIIFTMNTESFAKTKNGDAIRVRYAPDSQGVWEFGKLDKSKVKR